MPSRFLSCDALFCAPASSELMSEKVDCKRDRSPELLCDGKDGSCSGVDEGGKSSLVAVAQIGGQTWDEVRTGFGWRRLKWRLMAVQR